MRNLGIARRDDDEKDPREAILKYASEAAANPYWISPAYSKTQPKPIFQTQETDDQDQGPEAKKQKSEWQHLFVIYWPPDDYVLATLTTINVTIGFFFFNRLVSS